MGLAVACAGDSGFVFGGVIAALLFFIFVARYALATPKDREAKLLGSGG